MAKNISILVILAMVVGLPFIFKRADQVELSGDDTLVVVSPHNESIRYEFGRGFRDWYREKTGKDVAIDWRVLGGTSEIARYLQGEYTGAFKNYWQNVLKKEWSQNVQLSFASRLITPDDSAADDNEGEQARRAFLNSEVSCGIDVFFGEGLTITIDRRKLEIPYPITCYKRIPNGSGRMEFRSHCLANLIGIRRVVGWEWCCQPTA